MRQAIAAAMSRSKREIPHYYLSTTIDMNRASSGWRTRTSNVPSPTGSWLASCSSKRWRWRCARSRTKRGWDGGRVVQRPAIHVGVADLAAAGGLVAPALHDTDRLGLDDLMRNLRDLVRRARAVRLRSSELSDPTITVTNLGEQGVETVFAIIYPPQVAIVGFGKVMSGRGWPAGSVPRPVVTATLSADHRVTDGHRGGLFLAAIERLLQEPERL